MISEPAEGGDAAVRLRAVADADLSIFFEQQLDPEANRMAAFTGKDPADRHAFNSHWTKIRTDETVVMRTILAGGEVAGYVATFERLGEREVSYWIGRELWGRGIATAALRLFLAETSSRPLYARAAQDNAASIRVLEKCGFQVVGRDRFFANARGEETEEAILKLL
jgi:RimJ/RimL family protein N-acetyltransferase